MQTCACAREETSSKAGIQHRTRGDVTVLPQCLKAQKPNLPGSFRGLKSSRLSHGCLPLPVLWCQRQARVSCPPIVASVSVFAQGAISVAGVLEKWDLVPEIISFSWATRVVLMGLLQQTGCSGITGVPRWSSLEHQQSIPSAGSWRAGETTPPFLLKLGWHAARKAKLWDLLVGFG